MRLNLGLVNRLIPVPWLMPWKHWFNVNDNPWFRHADLAVFKGDQASLAAIWDEKWVKAHQHRAGFLGAMVGHHKGDLQKVLFEAEHWLKSRQAVELWAPFEKIYAGVLGSPLSSEFEGDFVLPFETLIQSHGFTPIPVYRWLSFSVKHSFPMSWEVKIEKAKTFRFRFLSLDQVLDPISVLALFFLDLSALELNWIFSVKKIRKNFFNHSFVVYNEERPIGILLAKRTKNNESHESIDVLNVYVLKEFRSKGIGLSLFEIILSFARKQKINRLRLRFGLNQLEEKKEKTLKQIGFEFESEEKIAVRSIK